MPDPTVSSSAWRLNPKRPRWHHRMCHCSKCWIKPPPQIPPGHPTAKPAGCIAACQWRNPQLFIHANDCPNAAHPPGYAGAPA